VTNDQTAHLLSPLVIPGLKSLQLHGAPLDLRPPPQLLCPSTLLGTPLHTPRHVPLVSHLLQNSALNSALKTVCPRFSAVFVFEADDCGRLVG